MLGKYTTAQELGSVAIFMQHFLTTNYTPLQRQYRGNPTIASQIFPSTEERHFGSAHKKVGQPSMWWEIIPTPSRVSTIIQQ